jgi:integrase/recombinase XerD
MGVKVRENIKTNGTKSLYLDIVYDGKRTKEYLGLSLIKALTKEDREKNKEIKRLAESIASKRQLEFTANEFEYTPAFKNNIDFLGYYQKFLDDYPNKDKRIVRYSLEWFKSYLKTKTNDEFIKPKDLTEELCLGYKRHLVENLNGETPHNYFAKFKKVIRSALKLKILKNNPCEDIKNEKTDGLKKDILNMEEVQILAKAYCGNTEVKRAFLFSLNTGLRWIDLKNLKYENIDFASSMLKINQQKLTGKKNAQVNIDLNNSALSIIGKPKGRDELIFQLPSHTGGLKSLRLWTAKAGIEKHITWHCGRHSFAVNILGNGTDIKTTSSLLGHSTLKHTEKYLHVVNEFKKKAVNTLPDLEF